MKRPLLFLGLLLLGTLLGTVLGQNERWTVQTAAFQDYRQASSQIAELTGLGFDAYSEFTMSNGQQYTRVRIGCFMGRSAAEAFANDLSGAVTAEAVAQPLNEGAATSACVEWDAGFVKPEVWTIERRQPDIVFRVEVGGQAGYLRHAGEAWEFTHSSPETAVPVGSFGRFREVTIGGQTLVQATLSSGERVNACTGELLWQSGLIAVVERSDSVIACVVDDSAPGGSP